MSHIAIRWVYSLGEVGGVETSVLAFLASHNFGSNQTFFSIKTISKAIKFSYEAVKKAFSSLAKKNLITKEARYSSTGAKTTNLYILNIPQEFFDSIKKVYDDLPVPSQSTPQVSNTRGSGTTDLTYNSNNINNNIIKKNEQKEFNKERYAVANLASVEKQSTSIGYQPETPEQQERRAQLHLEEMTALKAKAKANESKSTTRNPAPSRVMPNPWKTISQCWNKICEEGVLPELQPCTP